MKQPPFRFEPDRDYQGVYFLKVDASGHSSFVAQNTADIVDRFFNIFEDAVRAEVDEAKKLHGCIYSQFWGWAGDGGLCVIYDPHEESRARNTAVEAGKHILERRLAPLRQNLKTLNANGDFKIRVALHKGTMRYTDFNRQGSIHSRDLNFVAHLETATPQDTFTISREIFQQCPAEIQKEFYELPFDFEQQRIFAFSSRVDRDVKFDWIAQSSISGSKRISFLPRRYSESDKSKIISVARREVIDLGTALSTCSHYLISGKRPSDYRDAVIELLNKGVRYVCLALNPNTTIARQYAEQRSEPGLITKIQQSLESLSKFAQAVNSPHFEVWLYSSVPYFASIAIDRKDNGLMIFAPYLPNLGDTSVERADSPHMIIRSALSDKFAEQIDTQLDFILKEGATKRLI